MPLDDDLYGYSVALMFISSFSDGEIFNAFLLMITNIAGLVIISSYTKFFKLYITLLGVVGSGVAIYWLNEVVGEPSLHPYATLSWTIGIILLTVGYELKRRSIFSQANHTS